MKDKHLPKEHRALLFLAQSIDASSTVGGTVTEDMTREFLDCSKAEKIHKRPRHHERSYTS